MSEIPIRWPSAAVETQLAADLGAEAPTAPTAVAEAFLIPLTAYLLATHPGCDPDACATAAEDAILGLLRNPRAFDPSGLRLGAYLRTAARLDLGNERRKERRHHARRVIVDVGCLPDRALVL